MVRRTTNLLLIALVVSSSALADGPRLYQVAPTTQALVSAPDWVLTNEGKQRMDAQLAHDAQEKARLLAENSSLRADLVSWEAKPTLTPMAVLLLVAIGVVAGAAAVGIPLAVRR